MDYKVVVSDPKTGKSYQIEVKEEQARKIRGKKMGDSLDGALAGLAGYKLKVTGGSDRGGFPMKMGLHTQSGSYILVGRGVGYRTSKGHRARRRMHGEVVGDEIVQVNTVITEYGGKSVESLLGLDKPAEKAEDKKEG